MVKEEKKVKAKGGDGTKLNGDDVFFKLETRRLLLLLLT